MAGEGQLDRVNRPPPTYLYGRIGKCSGVRRFSCLIFGMVQSYCFRGSTIVAASFQLAGSTAGKLGNLPPQLLPGFEPCRIFRHGWNTDQTPRIPRPITKGRNSENTKGKPLLLFICFDVLFRIFIVSSFRDSLSHCWPACKAKREHHIGQAALPLLISSNIIVAALPALAASRQSTSH